ncbi:MAG TPA: SRPBCC family protein [Jiangellales bacterium]|nr:SRPBCC family protein [Jiangellales bacterium]
MSRDGFVVEVAAEAPAQAVWDGLVDWERQGEWVLGTRVRAMSQGGQGVGARVEAFTGLGPVGVPDTLVVEQWDPPRACRVRHLRYLVRGPAGFEVVPLGPARSRIVWWEALEPPFGPLGRLAWPVVERVLAYGFRRSLSTFAAQVAARHAAGGPA